MKFITGYLILFIAVLISSASAFAQQTPFPAAYTDLSAIAFKKEKDSIRKSWACPELYTNKETQAKYKEIWNSRTDFLVHSIDNNDYIKDGELYAYVREVLNSIIRGNPSWFPSTPMLIIDRSSAVNAYSLGGNVIVVNAGLISFCETREELALVLAHELSHDVMKHAENAMKERAVLLTSDEYKKSLESVLDSKYERLTRLKKIIAGYAFSRNRHNRYHESDADSMAILMLNKAGIAFHPEYFLRLDSSDQYYLQGLNNSARTYFDAAGLKTEDSWYIKRTKGLSSRSYNFRDSTYNPDSFKTHPDCQVRYENTLSQASAAKTATAIPSEIRARARKVIIWDLFQQMKLTACLFRVFREKDLGDKDPWLDFMVYNVIAALNYASGQMNRFNAIAVQQKELVSQDYFAIQTLFEQIPADELAALVRKGAALPFWSAVSAEEREFRQFMVTINGEEKSAKEKEAAARQYMNSYPGSIYSEVCQHFR